MGDKNYLLLRYEAAKSFWARLVILKKKLLEKCYPENSILCKTTKIETRVTFQLSENQAGFQDYYNNHFAAMCNANKATFRSACMLSFLLCVCAFLCHYKTRCCCKN